MSRDRVTEPILERNEDRIDNLVPSRLAARRAHYLAAAGTTGGKRDRTSVGRNRPGAKLGDSGDPIAEGGLRRCRSRRDNR